MADVSILVPVLDRPDRVDPLVESAFAATRCDWELMFIVSPGDDAELDAVRSVECECVTWRWALDERGPGDYARKINLGFRETTSPWIFQGADDLRFRPGWDTVAIETGEKHGVGVVGTNDLCNPRVRRGNHSTHSLIRRAYVDECGGSDTPGEVLYEGYAHNYVDDELVAVSMSRGCFAMSPAIVEHLHPNCGKAERGDTYALAMEGFQRDRALFQGRRPYWERAARQARQSAL